MHRAILYYAILFLLRNAAIHCATPLMSFPIAGNPAIDFYPEDDVCTVLSSYCKDRVFMGHRVCIDQILPQMIKQFTQAWVSVNQHLVFTPQFFIDCEPLQIEFDRIALFNSDYLTDYTPPPQYSIYRNSSRIVDSLLLLLRRAMQRDPQALADFNTQRNQLELTDPERASLYTQAILMLPSNLFVVDQFGLSLIYIGMRGLANKLFHNAVSVGLWGNAMQRPVSKYVRGLTAKPWHTPSDYPCVRVLEKGYRAIRDEFVMIYNTRQNLFTVEQENLHLGGNWTEIRIKSSGYGIMPDSKYFPNTLKIIRKLPADTFTSIKFSILQPGTHIRTHTGPSNERLRLHLCIHHTGGARIRVLDSWYTWQEGRVIVFDDSFEHEVVHLGRDYRAVLILDIWHPELPVEQRIVH